MKDTLASLSIADLNQRYSDTLVVYKNKLVYVAEFAGRDTGYTDIILADPESDPEEREEREPEGDPFDFDNPPPQRIQDIETIPRIERFVIPASTEIPPVIDPLSQQEYVTWLVANFRGPAQFTELGRERLNRDQLRNARIANLQALEQTIRDITNDTRELNEIRRRFITERLAPPIMETLAERRTQLRERIVQLRRQRDHQQTQERVYQLPAGRLLPIRQPNAPNRPEPRPLIQTRKNDNKQERFDHTQLVTQRPSSRWYLVEGKKPVYLYYSMQRQYQRGHNQRNTYIYGEKAKGLGQVDWNNFHKSLDTAYKEIGNSPDLKVGVGYFNQLRQTNGGSVLFSPNLLVKGDDIYYRLSKIGEFKNKQEVLLSMPQFDDELKERIAGVKIINGN